MSSMGCYTTALLRIDTHYTDTGGASDHVFILCALLGFCPRPRDLPERKLACIAPASTYSHLQPLFGQRIKTEVIREHWGEIIRLVTSLKARGVAPSAQFWSDQSCRMNPMFLVRSSLALFR